mmetsp:Transcript_719/g.1723  ORF Transcript_719/g.1723 Transcript_719/m.1723 type:complete len:248 (-) Transcript_719:793-1536(-)
MTPLVKTFLLSLPLLTVSFLTKEEPCVAHSPSSSTPSTTSQQTLNPFTILDSTLTKRLQRRVVLRDPVLQPLWTFLFPQCTPQQARRHVSPHVFAVRLDFRDLSQQNLFLGGSHLFLLHEASHPRVSLATFCFVKLDPATVFRILSETITSSREARSGLLMKLLCFRRTLSLTFQQSTTLLPRSLKATRAISRTVMTTLCQPSCLSRSATASKLSRTVSHHPFALHEAELSTRRHSGKTRVLLRCVT